MREKYLYQLMKFVLALEREEAELMRGDDRSRTYSIGEDGKLFIAPPDIKKPSA
jgi:hypothetical protein